MKSIPSKSNVQGEADYASANDEVEGRAHARGRAKVEQDKSPSGRPKPDKRAPGKHPHGRNPIPEKLPGR